MILNEDDKITMRDILFFKFEELYSTLKDLQIDVALAQMGVGVEMVEHVSKSFKDAYYLSILIDY